MTAQSGEEKADELLEEELYADEDEDELMPPEEENEARMLNTGTIIGVIMVGVLVIFLIAFVAMNAGSWKRKQQDSSELDKAGTKTVIEFKDKSPVDFSSGNSEKSDSSETEKSEKEIDDILETLPAEFQLPRSMEKSEPHLFRQSEASQITNLTDLIPVIQNPQERLKGLQLWIIQASSRTEILFRRL